MGGLHYGEGVDGVRLASPAADPLFPRRRSFRPTGASPRGPSASSEWARGGRGSLGYLFYLYLSLSSSRRVWG